MRTLLFVLIIIVNSLPLNAQSKKYSSSNGFDIAYTLTEGKLSGKYRSFYSNKQLRAKGKLENGYRVGKWTIWYSDGVKQIERVYSSPFTFKQTFPKSSVQPSAQPYLLKDNKSGYVDYFPVEEKDIFWYKRLWRTVSPTNNPILFNQNYLFNKTLTLANDSSIHLYSGEDDSFRKTISPSTIDIGKVDLLYYKIKEDWFIDTLRSVMECRIIGFCPVVRIGSDTTDLFWAYYPEMRERLALEKLSYKNLPTHIKTLEQLFFYRFFDGVVYKESNIYNDGTVTKERAIEIDLQLIESEHSLWINEAFKLK